jgi:nucleoside-diphosphate-sugar epimerase
MSASRETVLVTGAGGFLGGTLVEAIYFGRRFEVRAGISRWTSAPRIARLQVPIVLCDVMRPPSLAEAMAGVDSVVHCATSENLDVITEGTGNVLRAARAAGVRRVVHISSIAVYGAATGKIEETTEAPLGTLTPYGAAKRRAEKLCRETVAGGQDVVMLRPAIIYGPFAAQWTVLYAARLRSRRWRDLGPLGDGKCNLVHVHDVVRYALAALHQPEVAGEEFNINGPDIVTWNEYARRFNAALGLPPLADRGVAKSRATTALTKPIRSLGKYGIAHFSPQLIWLSRRSDMLKSIMQETEARLRSTPNAGELALFRLDAIYSMEKTVRTFRFAPSVRLDDGLAMCVAWLNHMGEAT